MRVEGKECAETKDRTQHTMQCGIGVVTRDPGVVSRAKAREAVLRRRLASNGEPMASIDLAALWRIGGKPVTEVQASTNCGLNTGSRWGKM